MHPSVSHNHNGFFAPIHASYPASQSNSYSTSSSKQTNGYSYPSSSSHHSRYPNGTSADSNPASHGANNGFLDLHSNATLPPPLPLGPMETRHYTILKEVGDGSFGTVWLADWHSPLNLPPDTRPPGPASRPEYRGKRLVAVKRMKKAFEGGWDECLKLKELKSLRTIPLHPNIIPLYDAFLLPSTKELYFVFECMEGNLYQLTKTRKGRSLAAGLVASLFQQILVGLHHIHVSGFFHRDMKPENLLITTTGLTDYPPYTLYGQDAAPETDVTVIVKLADFGLARESKSRPPYTEYVSTRWYRAPEVLLRSRDYSNPVDMWALGTILAEVVTLRPLFPGQSEMDQVFKICECLGDPSNEYGVDERGRTKGGGGWDKGLKLARAVGYSFQKMRPVQFSSLFDPFTVPYQLVDCMADLLRYDPKLRLTTTDCLSHPYFSEVAPRLRPTSQQPAAQSRSPQPTQHTTPQGYPPTPTSAQHGQTLAQQQQQAQELSIPMPQGDSMQVDSYGLPSPRVLPPSHSHGTPSYFKPPFGADDRPPPMPHSQTMPEFGGSSYNRSGYQSHSRNVSAADSVMSDRTVDSSMVSVPIVYNDYGQPSHEMSGQDYQAYLRAHERRVAVAASTFYDGSIFEGIAPTRQASIMSFPVGYGSEEEAPPPNFASPEPRHAQLPNRHPQHYERQPIAGPSHLSPSASQSSTLAPTSGQNQSSSKSRGWGFVSVFNSDSKNASTSTMMGLKRSPSNSSTHNVDGAVSTMDAKKAKKEAEKAAKAEEKAKREAALRAQRERARAVMQKRAAIQSNHVDVFNLAPVPKVADTLDKGKGPAISQTTVSSKLPQIIEDVSQLHVVDNRYSNRRRRDTEDDVHSVSSNETGASGNDNRFSMSSGNTLDSDPGPQRSPHRLPIHRAVSVQSLSAASRLSAGTPYYSNHELSPQRSSSSLDHQLISNMQSLATDSSTSEWSQPAHGRKSQRSPSPATSIDSNSRYSPYPHPSSRPSQQHNHHPLPPINTHYHHPPNHNRHLSQASSGAHSFHSLPSALPSHFEQNEPTS
ncbi:kinase-like protein [Atractiella rhizophila]|nr:kinase-like protein [Atractiella rhizophila]